MILRRLMETTLITNGQLYDLTVVTRQTLLKITNILLWVEGEQEAVHLELMLVVAVELGDIEQQQVLLLQQLPFLE
jgi:hypothetical protein